MITIKEINTVLNENRLPILAETKGKYAAKSRISSPENIADILSPLKSYTEEHFVCIALDTRNKVQAVFPCGQGTINTCQVDVRGLFQKALMFNTSAIVIAHNHPSGDSEPSKEDINVTRKVQAACKALDIGFLDHIIIGENYYSFLEHNLLT